MGQLKKCRSRFSTACAFVNDSELILRVDSFMWLTVAFTMNKTDFSWHRLPVLCIPCGPPTYPRENIGYSAANSIDIASCWPTIP